VSSASSGGRTVRASSQRGKRRSSVSNSGIFGRLRSRAQASESEDETEETYHSEQQSPTPLSKALDKAGPSDWYARKPSPDGSASPLATWRQSTDEPEPTEIEDGFGDYWRPSSPKLAMTPPRRTPSPDDLDDDQYQKRLQDVLGAQENTPAKSASPRGYGAEFRDVLDEKAINPLEEEEFGVLEFPLKVGNSGDVADLRTTPRTKPPSRKSHSQRRVPGDPSSVGHIQGVAHDRPDCFTPSVPPAYDILHDPAIRLSPAITSSYAKPVLADFLGPFCLLWCSCRSWELDRFSSSFHLNRTGFHIPPVTKFVVAPLRAPQRVLLSLKALISSIRTTIFWNTHGHRRPRNDCDRYELGLVRRVQLWAGAETHPGNRGNR
jgi:hypothetical protein